MGKGGEAGRKRIMGRDRMRWGRHGLGLDGADRRVSGEVGGRGENKPTTSPHGRDGDGRGKAEGKDTAAREEIGRGRDRTEKGNHRRLCWRTGLSFPFFLLCASIP